MEKGRGKRRGGRRNIDLNRFLLSGISGSHGGANKDYCLLECDAI
jgi:hypothetical protein